MTLNSLVLCFASLYPLLQQILIVAVSPSAQRVNALMGEQPVVGIYKHWHQPIFLSIQFMHLLHHLHHSKLQKESHG